MTASFPALSFQLEHLDLSLNRIETIFGDRAFDGLGSLLVLRLQSNALTSLPSQEALSPLHTLHSLDLGGNKGVGSLPPYAFKSLQQSLNSLSLRGCGLTNANLSGDAFSRLSALRFLDLSFNAFSSVPTSALSQLSLLEELSVGGNSRLHKMHSSCLKGLRRLSRLDVSNSTSLRKVEAEAFRTNEHLEAIDFDGCRRLRTFEPLAFAGPPRLVLSFADAGWTRVPEEVYLPESVASVDLGGNDLVCDCEVIPLYERLTDGTSFGNASVVECHAPDALRGAQLASVEDGKKEVGSVPTPGPLGSSYSQALLLASQMKYSVLVSRYCQQANEAVVGVSHYCQRVRNMSALIVSRPEICLPLLSVGRKSVSHYCQRARNTTTYLHVVMDSWLRST